MRRAVMIGVLGSLALAGASSAQEQCTVNKDSIKTWSITIDGKEYEAHPATPNYEGTTGLFHLPSAYTLPRKKVSVSLFRNNLDRDPKDEDISIHGVTLGFGATDRLELFGSFGLQNRLNADALFQPGFSNDYPFVRTGWETGAGDLKLGLKYKFLDDYMGDGLGMAMRGFVKLGTADEDKGLGTGKTSFGVDLLLSKSLGRKADIHGGIGYQVNSDPNNPRPIEIGNAINWGVGLNIPACRIFQIQAEVTGASYKGAEFKQTSPMDLIVGPVFWIKGFFIRPAISKNLNFDDRGLNSGGKSSTGKQISIGYHPGTACCAVATAPPPPPPPAANRNPTVSCETEKSQILAGETVRCRATGSDPDGDSLTYSWTASAGRVSGSGTTATFDSTGVAAPTTVTVTVSVSDGRGGTASANCPVRVVKEERRLEVITCTSGGFPRNLARLNNMDKACLDDVASRLRQDPRSRVVIVGHADSQERYPDVIGRKRAEAVKSYLVTDRGIEEARVTVRTSGSNKLLDTGTTATARARNRRVELIFVPEGATPPGE